MNEIEIMQGCLVGEKMKVNNFKIDENYCIISG